MMYDLIVGPFMEPSKNDFLPFLTHYGVDICCLYLPVHLCVSPAARHSVITGYPYFQFP